MTIIVNFIDNLDVLPEKCRSFEELNFDRKEH